MRLISYADKQGPTFGVVVDGGIVEAGRNTGFSSLREALAAGALDEIRDATTGVAPDVQEADVRILPIIPNPEKILCAGRNYKDHVEEMGAKLPDNPTWFIKSHQTLVAHGEPIVKPDVSDCFDFEGEFTAIIGKAGRHIAEADALDHVAGYTCFLDGSIRDYQKHSTMAGKNFNRTGPAGPYMVTTDELPDPTKLVITTRLNGEVVQHCGTDMLIFSLPRLISYISDVMPLTPGDLIATGSPSGSGAGRTPPLWMKVGDVVEVELSGVGVLRNPVVAEA
jgi:2-keto-4-pentenoate hydratase/2-oxohepta-3-ene-1,7-dioic acid hydratase in catechol pathway